jgi:multidrug efflux system membrane fusion protein
LLENARLDLQRYQELLVRDSISKQQVDTQAALVKQYEGVVATDKGQVENARLQLSYCRITSPVAGRVGLRQVDPGNQVHASDTNGLVVVAQQQPMSVVFSIPEARLPAISKQAGNYRQIRVEAWDQAQKNLIAAGYLLTTDNIIDTTTGTIKLKAEFSNKDGALFPNQFVNVRLLAGTLKEQLVIPGAALLRGEQGAFVYRADEQSIVHSIAVTPGQSSNDIVAIAGEIKAGDTVVTDGADKLRDGAKVEVIQPNQKRSGLGGDKHGARKPGVKGGHRGDAAATKPAAAN